MQYHVVETIDTLIFYKLCTKLNYTIRKKTKKSHVFKPTYAKLAVSSCVSILTGHESRWYFIVVIFFVFYIYILKQLHKKIVCAWLAKEITMIYVARFYVTKLGHLVLQASFWNQTQGGDLHLPWAHAVFWTCNK